ALACTWVLRDEKNHAVGVDLHGPTLDWGRAHNVAALGDAKERLTLVQDDVRAVSRPLADVTMALNFSYWIFKPRQELKDYFSSVKRGLKRDGMFVLVLFGGTESMMASDEARRIEAGVTFDGTRVPSFRYEWEQARYDPDTGDFLCRIHFRLT